MLRSWQTERLDKERKIIFGCFRGRDRIQDTGELLSRGNRRENMCREDEQRQSWSRYESYNLPRRLLSENHRSYSRQRQHNIWGGLGHRYNGSARFDIRFDSGVRNQQKSTIQGLNRYREGRGFSKLCCL